MRRTLIPFMFVLTPISSLAASTDYMMDYYSGNYYKASKALQELAGHHDKQALFYLGMDLALCKSNRKV